MDTKAFDTPGREASILERMDDCLKTLKPALCKGQRKALVGSGGAALIYQYMVGTSMFYVKYMDTRQNPVYWGCRQPTPRQVLAAGHRMEKEIQIQKALPDKGFVRAEDACVHYQKDEKGNLISCNAVIVMKPYRRLSSVMAQNDFTEEELHAMTMELCGLVGFLHHHKIVHRDIKPNNIYVVQDPASGVWHPVLGDFGTAVFTDEKGPIPVMGTLAYMPWQLKKWRSSGLYEKRCYQLDVFGLCATILCFLGGRARSAANETARRAPGRLALARALEDMLECSTDFSLACETVPQLMQLLEVVKPSSTKVIYAPLEQARAELRQGAAATGSLDMVYSLLQRGCDFSDEGCQRMQYFLQSEYGRGGEAERACEGLQRMQQEGDLIAGGMYWLTRLRRGDNSMQVLKGLEDSQWPLGMYICGQQLWVSSAEEDIQTDIQRRENRRIRSHGARLILRAAEQGVKEAQRTVANYLLVYEDIGNYGLRNYLPEEADHLQAEMIRTGKKEYGGFPIRSQITVPKTKRQKNWGFWDNL